MKQPAFFSWCKLFQEKRMDWCRQGSFDMILVTDGREVLVIEMLADTFTLTKKSDR